MNKPHVGDFRRSTQLQSNGITPRVYKTPRWRYFAPQQYETLSPDRIVKSREKRRDQQKSDQWLARARKDKAKLIKNVQDLLRSFKLKRTKLKRSKYPQKPKKAPNAYAIFFKQKASALRLKNPETEQQDITKRVGKEWKEMSDTQKLRYKEKEDHERQLQKQTNTAYISKQVKRGKRFKISRPVDYPRKAKTAYVLFVADMNEEAKQRIETSTKEETKPKGWEMQKMDKQRAIISKLGEMWNQTDEKIKQAYKRKAREDRQRFERELKAWREKNQVEDEFSAEGSLTSNSIQI